MSHLFVSRRTSIYVNVSTLDTSRLSFLNPYRWNESDSPSQLAQNDLVHQNCILCYPILQMPDISSSSICLEPYWIPRWKFSFRSQYLCLTIPFTKIRVKSVTQILYIFCLKPLFYILSGFSEALFMNGRTHKFLASLTIWQRRVVFSDGAWSLKICPFPFSTS